MQKDVLLARLERLYADYLSAAVEVEKNRKLTDLFGLKNGPADDPCHDRFAQSLAGLLSDFAAEAPDSEARRAVLSYLFEAPKRNPEPKSAYWMLVAVHGLARDLIGGLNTGDAAALAERYEAFYPRRARLPVQDEVLRALRQKGGGAPSRGFSRKKT